MINGVADASGAGSLITGTFLFIVDKVHLFNVNDFLVGLTTLGGLVWMVYKIIGQRLDNRIKRQELEKYIEENRR